MDINKPMLLTGYTACMPSMPRHLRAIKLGFPPVNSLMLPQILGSMFVIH